MKKFSFMVLCFLLISPSAWAAGESCESDADCADNEECVSLPQKLEVDCPPCAEGEDCPPCGEEDDGGEANALGTCLPIGGGGGGAPTPPEELLCDEDSDCGLGLVCTEHIFECKGAASSGGMASDPPTPIPTEPGCACECEAGDEECLEECDCGDDDDGGSWQDVPEGTETPDGEQDDAEGEDDDIDCEEEVVKVCGIDPTGCESDTDCIEGFECQEIEECWAEAVTSCMCAEGDEECDCEEEEPVETDGGCEVVDSFCRPKLSACGEEDACPEGWVCVGLPDGAEEDLGMESACLPEGWDVLLKAELSGASSSGSEETSSAVLGTGNSAPTSPNPPGGGGDSEGPEGETKKEEAKKAASGLCSVGNGGQFGLTTLLLLMGFVGLLAVRRERHQV